MASRFAPLLLHVLRRERAPDVARLAAMSAGDWDAFIAEAIRYRVAFQVSEWLKADPDCYRLVPEACRSRLDDSIRTTLMRNMGQEVHLRRVLAACSVAGLEVILLKGLWLAEAVYRDLRARATGDIDLLFRRRDIPRFTEVARELDFALPPNVSDICDLAPGSKEFPLRHPEHRSYLDIHWALTQPTEERAVDEEELWRRSEPFMLAGVPCRSLGLEDHLLFLCVHAVHHHFLFVGPRALLDVAEVIAAPPRRIDWDDLISRARELGWDRGAWLVLDLVREHLGVAPPQAVLDALRPADSDNTEIRAAAMEAMFLDQRPQQSLGLNLVRLMEKQSLRKRVALLFARLFPPREEVAVRFRTPIGAEGFRWLYVRRWRLLLREHLPKLIRLVAGDPARAAEFQRRQVIARWVEGREQ